MTDLFALLGEARRPWIETEALKARFLALAAETHPDRARHTSSLDPESATRRYAEINAAQATLSDPKSRLLHLLELELGQRPTGIEQAPPALLNQFMEVAQVCREVDRLRTERERETSPMLKVKLFERALQLTGQVKNLQALIREQLCTLESELKTMNAAWETAPPPGSADRATRLPLPRLAEIARSLSFGSRWQAQLQEKLVQLAL